MVRIAFLCSGGGGNLRFIEELRRRGELVETTLCGVVADRECGALSWALASGIHAEVADFSGPEQLEPIALLETMAPDLIVTNVHKILRPPFVERFSGRLVNLHYSLLPAFGGSIGTTPVKAAVAYGCKFAGVTAHVVEDEVDAGRPLVQVVFPIFPDEEAESVMDVVFRSGCICLYGAIELSRCSGGHAGVEAPSGSSNSSLEIDGRQVLVNPMPKVIDWYDTEELWQAVRAGA